MTRKPGELGRPVIVPPEPDIYTREELESWFGPSRAYENPVPISIYTERAMLLALVSCHYPSHVVPVTDPEPGFNWAVCVHIDGRQHAWHVSDEDLFLFDRLPRRDTHYDGHSSEQKYDSIWCHVLALRPLSIEGADHERESPQSSR